MSDDRRRVLDMVAQGKITVDEADELLKALGEEEGRSQSADRDGRTGSRPHYLRISVHKRRGQTHDNRRVYAWPGFAAVTNSGSKEVNIRVPLSLVRSGMRLGAIMPGGAGDVLSQVLRDRGLDVDLSKIGPDELDTLLTNMGEITVDVDQGRAQVRISAE